MLFVVGLFSSLPDGARGSLLMLLELPGNVPLTQPVPTEPCPGLLRVVPLCECLLGKSAPGGGITGPEGLNSDLDRSS